MQNTFLNVCLFVSFNATLILRIATKLLSNILCDIELDVNVHFKSLLTFQNY